MFEYEKDLVHYTDLFLAASRLLGGGPLPDNRFISMLEGFSASFRLGDTIRPLSLIESKAMYAEASLVAALSEFGKKAMSMKATNPIPPVSLVVTAVSAAGNLAKLCGCVSVIISTKIKTEIEVAGLPMPKEISYALRDMTLCAVAGEFSKDSVEKCFSAIKMAADVANFDLDNWNPGQDAKLN